jgi:trimethylamine---corrinoid protein Co-methyltransferase
MPGPISSGPLRRSNPPRTSEKTGLRNGKSLHKGNNMARQGFEGGQLRFLTDKDVRRVHETALRILEEVGLHVPLPEAVEVYRKGGARVGPGPDEVRLPATMVEAALRSAPRRVLLCGRDPDQDLLLEGRKVYAGTGGAEIHVLDLETGMFREATLLDVARLARLVDGLPHIDFYIRPVEAQDVPPEKLDVNKYFASLANTGKHVMGNVYGVDKVTEVLEMASLVAGGRDVLQARPIVSFITSWMLSPLKLNRDVTAILLEVVRQGMPAVLSSVAILGLTSPVTMAGNLALTHAEQLSGIVLTQLLRPGAPVVYGGCPGVVDMRNGTFSPGSIERQILNAAISQMAQHVGIPNYNIGGITDAKLPDIQAGYEKGAGICLTALAGSNYIHHAAGRIKDGVAYEQYVIDNEIIGMAKRAVKGIEVSDETLAFGEITEVGPGGSFMGQVHTVNHLRDELFFPALSDRNDRFTWEGQGSLDGRERARIEARRILDTHRPLPIPGRIVAKIRERFEIVYEDF